MREKLKTANKILYRRLKFVKQPVGEYIQNSNFRKSVKYANLLEKSKVKENLILYESYHGRSMTGNPYAIFKGLLNHKDFQHFQHVWAVDEEQNILRKYKHYSNVKFVKIHSDEYLRYLTQAKYLINNTSFPYYFQKKSEQIYINTWHGTPLKTLGTDIKDCGLTDHKNIQRNLLHTDYLISPNQFTYKKLLQSHNIDSLFNGKIADIGYPRVDSMFHADKDKIRKTLSIPTSKKIILYAPTWRGKVNQEEDQSRKLLKELEEIKKEVGNEYLVLLKSHYFAYSFFKENNLADICVPEWLDTNELLSIVDVLITDYSSIFFDFLPTKRQVIFYGDDLEQYEEERGFYLNMKDLPGPFCSTIQDVIHHLRHLPKWIDKYVDKYNQFLKTYCYHDDGMATERLINTVFKQESSDMLIHEKNNKIKILLYCGGFYNNGITMSAINLLNSIDYSKYEVAVIESSVIREGKEQNIKKLHPNVSVLYRVGQWNLTLTEWYKHHLILRRGLYSKSMRKTVPAKMYERELSRMLGNVKFDIFVDFGGYNPFWNILFAFSPAKKKCVYLHNIMKKEYDKMINGKYKHRSNLKVIFSIYRYFSKVISVSESANDENLKDLGKFIDNAKAKMVYVNNVIDFQKILDMKDKKKFLSYMDQEYLILSEGKQYKGMIDIKGIRYPNKDHINFINVARLSPEKGHDTLIKAFAEVARKEERARLYIVGEGPLEEEIQRLVKQKGLEEKVYFTGQVENPFVLMNECDCFVLSSEYEGQGLVLLESLVVGKPIIGTNVPGVRSVLEGGYGVLVEHNIKSLENAMLAFISDGIQTKSFDYKNYNKEAIEMFYHKVL